MSASAPLRRGGVALADGGVDGELGGAHLGAARRELRAQVVRLGGERARARLERRERLALLLGRAHRRLGRPQPGLQRGHRGALALQGGLEGADGAVALGELHRRPLRRAAQLRHRRPLRAQQLGEVRPLALQREPLVGEVGELGLELGGEGAARLRDVLQLVERRRALRLRLGQRLRLRAVRVALRPPARASPRAASAASTDCSSAARPSHRPSSASRSTRSAAAASANVFASDAATLSASSAARRCAASPSAARVAAAAASCAAAPLAALAARSARASSSAWLRRPFSVWYARYTSPTSDATAAARAAFSRASAAIVSWSWPLSSATRDAAAS